MTRRNTKTTTPDRTTLKAHVGTLADMGARFVDAWRRAERGEPVSESHVTFLDLDTMMGTLSPRRLELLRNVRRHGGYPSIRAIADALGRDYKNVHADVSTLVAAGLLVHEGRKIIAPWEEVQATVKVG
jgi:predicted transcriptional regulator